MKERGRTAIRLLAVVRPLARQNRDLLNEQKKAWKGPEWGRRDWFWRALLGNLAAIGDASGSNRLMRLYERITFNELGKWAANRRLGVLKKTLKKAKVRWADRKAHWLREDFERLQELGGPTKFQKQLQARVGRDAKIDLLRIFKGVGPKIARNIMMDVYHPDFRDSIAIDSRIKAISEQLGVSFKNYDDEEEFFVEAAHRAGLNGCQLDRLMWKFSEDILLKLEQPHQRAAQIGA